MEPSSQYPSPLSQGASGAYLQIAIDGPAGSGKSTIGERVARSLGYVYVDTGAFYRALTALALDEGIAPENGPALAALAARTPIRIVAPTVADGRQYTVLANARDVTRELRTPEVEAAVSEVSHHGEVRVLMRERQQQSADALNVVMVGRDIGTVVLPHADLKIFLTTSLDERALRRHTDLVATKGAQAPSLEEVREEIAARDAGDANQLRAAADAIVINNDNLTPQETVAQILVLVQQRLRERADRERADREALEQRPGGTAGARGGGIGGGTSGGTA
ncbi:MAG TPA: (d)CMP kinase [Ktedonobacterales bacterium]